jgi:hypothetical protein
VIPAPALGAGEFGPPAPAMIASLRRPKPAAPLRAPPPRPGNPFAALAVLRR